MPDSWLYWRALAWLGALLLIGSMWPIICAARPFPSLRDFSAQSPWAGTGGTDLSTNNAYVNLSMDSSKLLSVLNNTSDLTNRTESKSIDVKNFKLPVLSTRRDHPMAMVRRPRKPYDSNRVTAETIRSLNRQQLRINKNEVSQSAANGEAPSAETTATTAKTTDVTPLNNVQSTQLNGLNLESITTTSDLTRDAIDLVETTHVFNAVANTHTDSPSSHNIITTSTETDDSADTVGKLSASQHPVIDASTIKQSTIRSVFLDYVNFNEKTTLPIDITVKTTTKTSETLPRSDREAPVTNAARTTKRKKRIRNNPNLERNERSANLSLARTSKRIQLLIKSRLLQLLPDGTVNGTQNDESDYTILQRATVDVGQIRLQGVATCLYLCMDACGNLYGARDFTNDCVFNERMQDNYNYYTSTHHSTSLKTFYVALNRMGGPRKTHIPSNKALGKLSTYVRSITLTVSEQKSDALVGRMFGMNHIKHGLKHLCTSNKALHELTAKKMLLPTCSVGKSASTTTTTRFKRPPPPPQEPIAFTDQRNQRKVLKCTQEPCPKKKKKLTKVIVVSSPPPDIRRLTGHTDVAMTRAVSQKQKKKQKVKQKNRKQMVITITDGPSTTPPAISVDENLISDDDDDDDLPSTGPSSFSSNANDDYGYDS